MSNPIVSVVMSVYKDRGALRQSIESVLSQSFEDLEFIIVDDASPDRTIETLRAVQDGRVRIVQNDSNLGLTRSLNRGLDLSRGEFIARIDEGDVWLEGKLDQQVAFLREHSDHVIVGSQYRNQLPDGAVVRATSLPSDDQAIRQWLFSGLTPMTHPAILFRNGTIKYNPRANTSQDFELYLRLSFLGKACNLPDELVSVLRPPDAISASKEQLQFFDHLQMHMQFLDVLKGKRDRAQFLREGADFDTISWWLSVRRRYMAFCLRHVNRIGNDRWRRILKNAFIPDVLFYLLRKRSAPYRFRAVYRAWLSHSHG